MKDLNEAALEEVRNKQWSKIKKRIKSLGALHAKGELDLKPWDFELVRLESWADLAQFFFINQQLADRRAERINCILLWCGVSASVAAIGSCIAAFLALR